MFLIIIVYLFMLFYISKYPVQMMQQNRYNGGNRYLKWVFKNLNSLLFNINLIFCVSMYLVLANLYELSYYLIFFVLFVNIFLNYKDDVNDKLPLKYTNRVKRIFVTEYIFNILVLIFLYTINFNYCILFMLCQIYFRFILILIPNFLNKPIEFLITSKYKKDALKKLYSFDSLDVVGITGSYGKTSSKNILNDILSVKYNSVATPLNYNTPYGMIITINKHLNKFTDVFIAEMGAFKKGEIKELCDMVKPKYGILTNIGVAHLESFGSPLAIQKTKFELIESLPEDGLGILNMDDPNQMSYDLKTLSSIKYISLEDKKADTYAFNINLTSKGSTFDVKFKGDKTIYTFETKLLGKANIYNIIAAVTLGAHLGISIKELKSSVRSVKQVTHRLELKNYKKGIYLIDDAYNSNPSGAAMALDTINLMPGTRVIVTPGMIELGDQDESVHYDFGKHIAKTCDYVVLVGPNKTKDIYRGLSDSKFDLEKVIIINDVKEAFVLFDKLKEKGKDLYALLENDLPDSFKEGKK